MSLMTSQITSISIVHLTVCSGADQRKHQSSASLAFVRGIHWWPVNSPHKGPVTRKMFPFDDVIMIYTLFKKKGLSSTYHPKFSFSSDVKNWHQLRNIYIWINLYLKNSNERARYKKLLENQFKKNIFHTSQISLFTKKMCWRPTCIHAIITTHDVTRGWRRNVIEGKLRQKRMKYCM